MTALRVLIVDDEAHARERLRRLLTKDAGIEIVGECSSGPEAVATVSTTTPDLMLLDIQMPEVDGFGVLRAIPPRQLPLVVFVTAYDRHAVSAFDVQAVDYLLKPVESPRLFGAIARARARLKQEVALRNQDGPDATARVPGQDNGASSPEEGFTSRDPERLLVRDNGHLHAVRATEVQWIEAEGNYARLHLADRKLMVRETMGNVERRLDPRLFARVHRSAIVNLDAIHEVQPWFAGELVIILKTGVRLKVSRHYKSRLDRWVIG